MLLFGVVLIVSCLHIYPFCKTKGCICQTYYPNLSIDLSCSNVVSATCWGSFTWLTQQYLVNVLLKPQETLQDNLKWRHWWYFDSISASLWGCLAGGQSALGNDIHLWICLDLHWSLLECRGNKPWRTLHLPGMRNCCNVGKLLLATVQTLTSCIICYYLHIRVIISCLFCVAVN